MLANQCLRLSLGCLEKSEKSNSPKLKGDQKPNAPLAYTRKKKVMGHAWINYLAYADIKDKWDMDTCIKFLMLSETTQKRLPGAPRPHQPCAVKEIVSQRLHFLLAEEEEQNKPIDKPLQTMTTPVNMPCIDTLNLLLMIIRHAFPSYPKVILPMAGFSTASKLNHDIRTLQQQLLDIVAWLDNQNHNTSKDSFLLLQ